MAFNLDSTKDVAAREDEGIPVEIRKANGNNEYYGMTDEEVEKMSEAQILKALEDGRLKPVLITVAGTYSNIYRRAADSQRNRLMKRQKVTLTGDEVKNNALELVASCVISWEGVESKGQPIECNKDNVIAVLRQAPWVREQLEEAMSDHESFFKKA